MSGLDGLLGWTIFATPKWKRKKMGRGFNEGLGLLTEG